MPFLMPDAATVCRFVLPDPMMLPLWGPRDRGETFPKVSILKKKPIFQSFIFSFCLLDLSERLSLFCVYPFRV